MCFGWLFLWVIWWVATGRATCHWHYRRCSKSSEFVSISILFHLFSPLSLSVGRVKRALQFRVHSTGNGERELPSKVSVTFVVVTCFTRWAGGVGLMRSRTLNAWPLAQKWRKPVSGSRIISRLLGLSVSKSPSHRYLLLISKLNVCTQGKNRDHFGIAVELWHIFLTFSVYLKCILSFYL